MSMKVLIVDPDQHFCEMATKYLESHAHLTVTTADTADALAQVRGWQADLVIVAGEVVDRAFMNSLYGMRPRPAVLVTEHLDSFGRAWRVWQMGGDELLMKPVLRAAELHEAIVTALENAAAGVRGLATHPVAVPA